MLIFQRMLTLFFLMGVGYFMHYKGWITDQNSNLLSKIVVNIANPAMIIAAGMDSDTAISNQIIIETVLIAMLFYVVMVVTAALVVRILRIPKNMHGTYQYMYVFGNIGFMGIPLISSIYGSEYALLIALYNFFFILLMYTYGIIIFRKEAQCGKSASDGEGSGIRWQEMINAGTIACLIALLCFVSKIAVPGFISNTFDMLGNLCAPLSMFVIGSSLAMIKPKDLISDMRLNAFILVRLIIIPIAAVGFVSFLNLDELLLRTFYIVISVPFASTSVLMAEEYGGNVEVAARGVALSSIVAVLSLPLVGLLFGM